MYVHCVKCGTPWATHELDRGVMTPEEMAKFSAGEGCLTCSFGQHCVTCGGVGRLDPGCSTCHGRGSVLVRKWLNPPKRARKTTPLVGWTYGRKPDWQTINDDPFYLQADAGSFAYGRALCPDCQRPGKEMGAICRVCQGSGELVSGTAVLPSDDVAQVVERRQRLWGDLQSALPMMLTSGGEMPERIAEMGVCLRTDEVGGGWFTTELMVPAYLNEAQAEAQARQQVYETLGDESVANAWLMRLWTDEMMIEREEEE